MPQHSRFRIVISLFGLAAFASAALLGCTQFTSPSPFPITPSATASAVQTLALAPAPAAPDHPIILSIEEAGYAHLFLFAPETTDFTRLTYGKWNDITPSISPDGTRIAFASNRGGHWDLYTLELASGQISQLTDTPEYDAAPAWSPDLAWI